MSKFDKGIIITVLITLILASLLSIWIKEKQKTTGTKKHVDWGASIDVMLKDGSSVTLICPKSNFKFKGGHGRECYIYEKGEF